MTTQQLEASVRDQPGVSVIDLEGDVDALADDALNAAYADAAARSPGAILLNFADVGYINSTGIAVIVGLLVQARKAGARILATGLSDHYMEIFEITRLSDFMSIFPDEESAVADVGSTA